MKSHVMEVRVAEEMNRFGKHPEKLKCLFGSTNQEQ